MSDQFPLRPPTPPSATPPSWGAPPPPPPPNVPVGPLIRWGLGDVLIGLAIWLLGGVVAAVLLVAMGEANTPIDELGIFALVISIAAGWPGFVGWPLVATYWKGQRSLRLDFGLDIVPIDVAWGIAGGVGAFIISLVGSVIWMALSGEAAPTNTDFLPKHPGAFTVLALVLLIAVCTPIVEELFFRGLFLRALGRRWNLTVGVIVSSVVFGLFHFQGSSLAQGLFICGVTAAYGAMFAFLVIRANGRLGPSIVAHMCVNLVGVLATIYL